MFQPASGSPPIDTPADGVFDVAVVGAGAAGVGAGRRLSESGASFILLEAHDRPGGRAHSLTGRSGASIDLGCGWLHSADRNPWVAIAEADDIDGERKELQQALALEPKLMLFDEATAPWRPMLDAFSSYYNGAPFAEISVHDYAAYQPTDENWRVVQGYGALVAHAAADLPILYEAPVRRIDRSGAPLRLTTAKGEVQARTAIVAVPTTVLAEARLAFAPPLPELTQAAAALPLGHVDKCFLALGDPDALPSEVMVSGRTDTADTGSYTLRPFGRPLIEGFFGGDLAAALEQESRGAFTAHAIDELTSLFGSSLRTALRPLAESRWGQDPYIRGAYSHALPGQAGARAALRRPVEGRIFFAGEACSAHAFSTAHGAFETGMEAAEAALAGLAGFQGRDRR